MPNHFTPAPDMPRIEASIQRDLVFMTIIALVSVCVALPAAFLVAGGGM